ncbi:hypothetical protein [Pseudomonas typographi]|uniref:hypothetical protein n=1 Tax=Pseudomonas typographi TaxID=2715964 RepID=UPI001689A74C|nr:hypothetical protein [Pseudomonas typographi]MBD1589552.1 hypothetical protein [Pseudomonas typographi]
MTPLLLPLLAMATFAVGPAYALDITQLDEQRLRQYSHTLAKTASQTQWQLLWQASRRAGLFAPSGPGLRFTLAHTHLSLAARQTLQTPDSITRHPPGHTHSRREFAPLTVGAANGQVLTAICIMVDWRGVETHAAPQDGTALEQARLLEITPC